jgi:hypothetical protein
MTEAYQLPIEQLLGWLSDDPDAPGRAAVAAAIAAGDQKVIRTLDWLGWLVHDARSAVLESPPTEMHERLVALFDRRSKMNDVAPRQEEFESAISFDSRQDLVGAGTRGSATDQPGFYLAFTSRVADIVLHFIPGLDQTFIVRGQLLAGDQRPLDPMVASVLPAAAVSTSSLADALGRFTLPAVSVATKQLVLENAAVRLLVNLPLLGAF